MPDETVKKIKNNGRRISSSRQLRRQATMNSTMKTELEQLKNGETPSHGNLTNLERDRFWTHTVIVYPRSQAIRTRMDFVFMRRNDLLGFRRSSIALARRQVD